MSTSTSHTTSLASSRSTRAWDLDIVVPAYNEERRLRPALEALTAHLGQLQRRTRITVVDNGSVDRTAEVLDAVARCDSGTAVRLIGCSRQGKGAAVRRGVLASDATYVGFCDADLATPVATLDAVLRELDAGAPVVIGSRRCVGASMIVEQPLVRRVGSWGFRSLSAPLVGGITDTQCGFKFFSRDAAHELFRRSSLDGFAFDVELLGLALRLGLAVQEVPVTWSDCAGSSFKPVSDGLRAWQELRAVRLSLQRQRADLVLS